MLLNISPQMLSPWMLSVVLLAVSASPFTEQRSLNLAEQDETMQAAFEKKEEALEEVELRERALEEQLLKTLLEEERLLDTELTGSNTAKFIDSNVEGEKFSFQQQKAVIGTIVQIAKAMQSRLCGLTESCGGTFVATAGCRQAPFVLVKLTRGIKRI